MFTGKEQSRENNNNNKNNKNNNNNINNLKKSYTEKNARHEPSGSAMLTRCSFDKEKSKLDHYRGEDN